MWRTVTFLLAAASALQAQPIRELVLDPRRAVDLPISREVTTLVFPGPLTAVAGADLLIDDGKGSVEIEENAALRFHVTHAPGANFVLVQSLRPDAVGRLTLIYEGAAYVVELHSVEADAVASAIFSRNESPAARQVDGPPATVRFSPRIGLSLLDRARAFPVLARVLPETVAEVTHYAPQRTTTLPDLEIAVDEVYRFAREDAVVFLLRLRNTGDHPLALAPETFAARVGPERFTQSIANGPLHLDPGESAPAEFAVVGLPDGTRNDLSAQNAFTILINTAPVEVAVAANATATTTTTP